MCQTPHTFICSPACLCSRGYCMCYGGTSHMLGALTYLSGFWCLVSTSIGCPLCFFLYLSYTSLCCKSTSTAMTTTPPVTVASSGMSSLSLVTMAASLMGLPTMLGQHDVVLPPPLTLRGSGGVLGHASVPQQQPPSLMPLQACANYAMGSPQVGFFSELSLPPFCILYIWCLLWCLLSTFGCHAGCHIHPWGLNHGGLHHCNPLEFTHGRHMCHLVMVISPTPGMKCGQIPSATCLG